MIGFYDYTVVLTYISLVCSIFGMTQAISGRFRTAIVCLALSGLCDMFDGKIARTKKNRTEDEKLFGVQIDSLCDVVCFGVFPALMCYVLGVRGVLGGIVISYYAVCSVIRLGFYNVLETNRQRQEDGANQYYHGLPITTITIVLPLIFLFNFLISQQVFVWVLMATLYIVGTLFIINFKLRKPSNKQLFLLVMVVACAVIVILLFSRYHIAHMGLPEIPLIKKLLELRKIL
ncbi:CDP-diacylglycerol--serine O-phosphatidyltransferase [Lachnotalea glycerini]|uniref:CDP-diacylglycerol--serine O-phosphatidyltransferase n=1 Tax=Lachnotalea glycerini TaxID=1763509 RepID=A0A255IA25_9FIRM|nr:CDP-alcohol phosphatidyltransferase family protein [Lachnotalea glycerini]PXV84758.1 CDP-diacylglycerol--serine O-phosphatidyltransferase [Lachnotalea glycerini]RDY30829.1 CDP-diacylglycerol--serine O-phosphatidyltransferase [Lachnotalea glycerini]